MGSGPPSRPCDDYNDGRCGCNRCIYVEQSHNIYRDRESELVIDSKFIERPTSWIINDHRGGSSQVTRCESRGVTKGYQFGVDFPHIKITLSEQWTQSTADTETYNIPAGFKGRIKRTYIWKKIRRRYLYIKGVGISDGDGAGWIYETHIYPNPEIVDLEYLQHTELELIPLIKTHIYKGIPRKMDETISSFKNCTIQVNHSSKFIDVYGGGRAVGTKISQWDWELNNRNQRFTFSLIPESSNKGYFICECCGNDKTIGVTGEIKAGSPLQVQDIDTKSKKQIFRLHFHCTDGNNYWCTISSEPDTNLVWEIEDEGSKSNGKRLILAPKTGKKNQQFCLNNSDVYN